MADHRILVIILLCTCLSSIYANTNDGTTASSLLGTDDEEQSDNSSFIVEHVSSTINSITIRWNTRQENTTRETSGNGINSDVRIEAYNAMTRMTIVSPKISSTDDSRHFTIPDLAVDAEYRICVVRIDDDVQACSVIRTIPMMRLDSLLAVLLTLAFIALLILTAVVCWRCALYQATPRCAEDEPEACNDDNGKVGNASPTTNDQQIVDEKVPLLAPGSKTATPGPNNDQQTPTTLYLFLSGPALDANN